jgi:hypothetical protein
VKEILSPFHHDPMIFHHVFLKILQASFHLGCFRHPDPLQLEQNLASRKHAIRFSKNEAKGREFPNPSILQPFLKSAIILLRQKWKSFSLFSR